MDDIFRRIENKYLLNKKQFKKIEILLNKYFIKDKYYYNKIYNIYFNNDNHEMIINSNNNDLYKKKIRLRSYGIPNDNDNIFLEIKEKVSGIVYKRRVNLTVNEYHNYFNKGIFPKNNYDTMKEIDYFIKHYKLHPDIFIAYDRLSYYSKDNNNFRLTIDNKLRYRTDNLELKEDNDKLYFDDDIYIMEVKCLDNLPSWFIEYLNNNKIYSKSFSKIRNIYIKENIKGNN